MKALVLPSLLAGLCLAACGCERQSPSAVSHGHPHHEHEHSERSGARFKEGAGLKLSEEAGAAMGLGTAEVATRRLALQFSATARVFHAAHQHGNEFPGHKDGHAYANVMLRTEIADLLTVGQPVELERPGRAGQLEGRLGNLDREMARAIGQAEAVIEIPDPEEALEFGVFLTARFKGAERMATVVPRPALVEAATGAFVYVDNGGRWLRTLVKTGGGNEDFVEILEGVLEGDVVASSGAVDLWLVELRLTKGGGHSH